MNNQEVLIKLKSFDHKLLDQAAKAILLTVKTTGANVCGPVPLPTSIKRFTVNRSPHVHKKSREQFEIRKHRRLIRIVYPGPQTIDALTNVGLAAGVDVEIKLVGAQR